MTIATRARSRRSSTPTGTLTERHPVMMALVLFVILAVGSR
jgi:hypothetical protein